MFIRFCIIIDFCQERFKCLIAPLWKRITRDVAQRLWTKIFMFVKCFMVYSLKWSAAQTEVRMRKEMASRTRWWRGVEEAAPPAPAKTFVIKEEEKILKEKRLTNTWNEEGGVRWIFTWDDKPAISTIVVVAFCCCWWCCRCLWCRCCCCWCNRVVAAPQYCEDGWRYCWCRSCWIRVLLEARM